MIYKTPAQKSKDQSTRTPLQTGGELMCSGRGSSCCVKVAPIVLLLVQFWDLRNKLENINIDVRIRTINTNKYHNNPGV